MLRNYFKTAWRNLLKTKTFSAINVSGLAIGIAAFLLIVSYLRFEYSFDDYNVRKDRIFRVPMEVTEGMQGGAAPERLRNWLQDYAYHISIGVWFFLAPVGMIVVVAMCTVCYHSLRAALADPAKNLKAE